jgi:hypothetical protein
MTKDLLYEAVGNGSSASLRVTSGDGTELSR